MSNHTPQGNLRYPGESDRDADLRVSQEFSYRLEQERLELERLKKKAASYDSKTTPSFDEGELTGLGQVIQYGGIVLILASIFTNIGVEWFGSIGVAIAVGIVMALIKAIAKVLPAITTFLAAVVLFLGWGQEGWLNIASDNWIVAIALFIGGGILYALVIRE